MVGDNIFFSFTSALHLFPLFPMVFNSQHVHEKQQSKESLTYQNQVTVTPQSTLFSLKLLCPFWLGWNYAVKVLQRQPVQLMLWLKHFGIHHYFGRCWIELAQKWGSPLQNPVFQYKLGMGKIQGEDWPKGYSISYDIVLGN